MLRSTLICAAIAGSAVAQSGDCTTWYESTQHGPGFRNVKTYGARGDGVTDDSNAIIAALTQGRNPAFTTVDPTVVYFPPGNYMISQTLPLYFYTFMVGNFRCRPTITLIPSAFGSQRNYMVDSDEGDEGGEHTDEFYRGISHLNFVVGANNPAAIVLHWAQSQASHIRNVSIDVGDGDMGFFMENGSGGWISDVNITGGNTGAMYGNQQWTFRSLSIDGSRVQCINAIWNWAFVFAGISLSNCPVGIQFTGNAAGTLVVLDSFFSNMDTGIVTDYPGLLPGLLIERLTATNVTTITNSLPGATNGVTTIQAWRQGPLYASGAPQNGNQSFITLTRPDTPLPARARPVFGSPDGSTGVYNVYTAGAKGDGTTDDWQAVQTAITNNAQVFFPQGIYLISKPLQLRPDSVLVGEALSNIQAMGGAAAWSDASNPQPLIATADASTNPSASVKLADLIFTASGDAPGCLLVDWAAGPSSGLWDTHWRMQHTAWGLMRIHGAAAGGYFENFWAWVADHDINTGANLTVVNPRGVSVDGAHGGVFMIGTAAEHSALYQYNVSQSSDVTFVMTQTESAYWQNPPTGFAMTITNSSGVSIRGAGYYNWFNGIQQAIVNVAGSPDTMLYDINVHGVATIITGDETISANATGVANWFCDYFIANTIV